MATDEKSHAVTFNPIFAIYVVLPQVCRQVQALSPLLVAKRYFPLEQAQVPVMSPSQAGSCNSIY